MGARGPAPTPKAILQMRGSWRAKEVGEEPKPQPGSPSPPSWLSREARAEWKRIVPALQSIGLLCTVDRAALAILCQSWADYREADRKLKEEGLVVKTKTASRPNPLLAVRDQAFHQWAKLAAQFGLSPSARARLKAPEDATPKTEQGKDRFFAG